MEKDDEQEKKEKDENKKKRDKQAHVKLEDKRTEQKLAAIGVVIKRRGQKTEYLWHV